jgi:hypothetical protein
VVGDTAGEGAPPSHKGGGACLCRWQCGPFVGDAWS